MQIKWGVCSLLLFSCAASAIPLPPNTPAGGGAPATGLTSTSTPVVGAKDTQGKPTLALQIPGSQNAQSSDTHLLSGDTSLTHKTPALHVPDGQIDIVSTPTTGGSKRHSLNVTPVSARTRDMKMFQDLKPTEHTSETLSNDDSPPSHKEVKDKKASGPEVPSPIKSAVHDPHSMKSWFPDPSLQQDPKARPLPDLVSVSDHSTGAP